MKENNMLTHRHSGSEKNKLKPDMNRLQTSSKYFYTRSRFFSQ